MAYPPPHEDRCLDPGCELCASKNKFWRNEFSEQPPPLSVDSLRKMYENCTRDGMGVVPRVLSFSQYLELMPGIATYLNSGSENE